jgi:hypothetical protein
MAIPAWTVSKCDGGHDSEAGCERPLLLYAAECLWLFGARPQGIPESFSLSWSECGRTIPVQAVHFWSFGDNASIASKRWHVGRTLSAKRQRPNSAIIGVFFDGEEFRVPEAAAIPGFAVGEDQGFVAFFNKLLNGHKLGVSRYKAWCSVQIERSEWSNVIRRPSSPVLSSGVVKKRKR